MAQQTKDSILDAAASLFGEQGFDNVSVRDITNRANVNLSALSYHFTDKAGLVEEVIVIHVEKLNTNRISLLAKANLDHDNNPPLRSLLEAFIAPLYLPEIHKTHPSIIAALTARTMIQQDENNPYNHAVFQETVEQFIAAFLKIRPKTTETKARGLMKMAAGAAISFRSFAYEPGKLTDIKATASIYTEQLNQLLDFCEAGFSKVLS